ncbi:MAG: tripartite tricarboxylate transporter substrate binding protein [Betaproteobacteria bacterium]
MKRGWIVAAAVAATVMPVKLVTAQDYPNRPIRIIVAFPPGASTDIVARLVGQRLSDAWGQNVVIENRPGAGGNIGSQIARRANPDGYTLMMNSSAFAVNVSLYRTPGYAMSDFIPVLQGPTTPNLISVHPSVKVTTLKELIALARTAPMSYASSGTGTTPHLDMEVLFRSMSKIDITHVPYGPAQAVTAVVGNQVPVACTSMPPAVPHVQAGRLRPIAVTTAERSRVLPKVPTVAESGFPGFDDYTWFSFFAPAGTSSAIVAKLNQEVTRILQLPEVKARLDALSLEFTPNTPAQFAARLKAEVKKYEKVVRESGTRVD